MFFFLAKASFYDRRERLQQEGPQAHRRRKWTFAFEKGQRKQNSEEEVILKLNDKKLILIKKTIRS